MRQFIAISALLVSCSCLAPPLQARTFFKGDFERPADIPASDSEAARFLTQATFGPVQADIDKVRTIGRSRWIDQQMLQPTTPAFPYMMGLRDVPKIHGRRMDRHLHTFVVAPDQLRQRMAFALSEIFVISSQHPALITDPSPQHFAGYWDMLADGAFGSYAVALKNVTHHITMGKYLSHFRNRKAGPGHEPDENYAREIMQLFSVGLKELNIDGTPMLDAGGNPIPTYAQGAITDLAKVFTGFTYTNAGNNNIFTGSYGAFGPMKCFDSEHDMTAKTVIGNTVLPAAVGCNDEVDRVINLLASHRNAAPFIARLLIQRFTTSNPSRAYVRRVAEKFRDNGDREAGDLGAVVRQILLDPEARQYPPPAGFGKIREPLLQVTAILRAWPFQLPVPGADGNLPMARNSIPVTQVPLNAPSVFNFYSPDYQPPGALQAAGIYAPELESVEEASVYSLSNSKAYYTFSAYVGGNTTDVRPYIDLDALGALSDAELIGEIDRRMLYGTMSPGMRAILAEMLPPLASANGRERARSAILVAALSPEFVTQR
ncbi:uncharacterized protein (DUF1800 family) [Tahibacter aquaticus]|uniref:Uncharacterized protein (DUF1800 family) n=1 Tax=Tahibacter aquaticus TaxID=520092 RepID=A0A4R6YU16_9GAMM|nr:DUF1800 family protein [Tahibacter aquaticus]TDR41996.1 uncharacterized protein (DUF1800 family) [Tahibacter aquaticus]